MKHEDVFERRDPPLGGLARLRKRLDESPSSPSRVWEVAVVAAPALAIAAIVLLVLSRLQTPDLVAAARGHGGLDEVALGLASLPAAPVALAESTRATAGIAEVRTSNPNVVFAWLVSTE